MQYKLLGNTGLRVSELSEIDPGFALKFLRRLQNLFLGAATETLDFSLHPVSRMILDRDR